MSDVHWFVERREWTSKQGRIQLPPGLVRDKQQQELEVLVKGYGTLDNPPRTWDPLMVSGTHTIPIWVFPKIMGNPQIINFHRVFPYKPISLGIRDWEGSRGSHKGIHPMSVLRGNP